MTETPIISTTDLNLWYHEKHALQSVSIGIPKNKVTALIGPSGLRQVHPAALLQPAQRPDRSREDHRGDHV